MEVVCTNIDNNLVLGSDPRAPTYRPAAELTGAQFENENLWPPPPLYIRLGQSPTPVVAFLYKLLRCIWWHDGYVVCAFT
ncbi:hypothetical protein E2C01_065118 [Portunus trituberculatus]|uniref:Uncharacterized protein n=1 Tax=Portunus trituberculatus TaxID=210409 RepID=A0A5B7HNR6_PORTR|nr:hypothetical protein [Portunus trituberculatus]